MLRTGQAAAAETESDCLQHDRHRPTFSGAWFRLSDRAYTPTDTRLSYDTF